jgi:hypothetical protein
MPRVPPSVSEAADLSVLHTNIADGNATGI